MPTAVNEFAGFLILFAFEPTGDWGSDLPEDTRVNPLDRILDGGSH
jgi:hypothetical protein